MSRKSSRNRPGVTLVECAIVMSLCLLLVFAVLEYGRLAMTRQVLNNAALEGARYAAVHTYDKATTDIRSEVQARLGGVEAHLQSGANASVPFNPVTDIKVYRSDAAGADLGLWSDAAFGQYISVRITATYKPVLPVFLFLGNEVPLAAQCIMTSEAN